MRLSLLLLLALSLAPAALAQKPEGKPEPRALPASPFVGTWDYVVRPDDPVARGIFTIEQRGDALGGTFMTDAPREIEVVEVSGDQITFTIKQPGMGVITIRGTLAGDTYTGEAQPEDQGALPFVATRHPDDGASDE